MLFLAISLDQSYDRTSLPMQVAVFVTDSYLRFLEKGGNLKFFTKLKTTYRRKLAVFFLSLAGTTGVCAIGCQSYVLIGGNSLRAGIFVFIARLSSSLLLAIFA